MDALEQPLDGPGVATPSLSLVALGLARAKLKPPIRRRSLWPLLGAAGLAAGAALCLASVVILGPPSVVSRQIDVDAGVR
jgi:hypothetical protein